MEPQHETSMLLALPEELLLGIVEQLDERDALVNLAATCSYLRNCAEAFIWRSLLVLRGLHADYITRALEARPLRATFIEDLAICYNEQHGDGIDFLDPYIPHMSRLRCLTIESPCPNNYGGLYQGANEFTQWTKIDYTKHFAYACGAKSLGPPIQPILQHLQSLTLHGHRSEAEAFDLGGAAVIFCHPTVRNITLSCTNFDAQLDLANMPHVKLRSTPLQSLTFIECNVYLSLLDVVMSLPKALRELTIGERLYAWDGCLPSMRKERTTHPRFLDTLHKQADSLVKLVHGSGNGDWTSHHDLEAHNGAKLRDMKSLKHIELDVRSFLLAHLSKEGPPETLQSITLSDDSESKRSGRQLATSFSFCHMLAESARPLLPTILTRSVDLDLRLSHRMRLCESLEATFCGSQEVNSALRNSIYPLSTVLKAHGCHFRIIAHTFMGNDSFIPPFMYGEQLPQNVIVYDSDRLWTFLNHSFQVDDESKLDAKHKAECGQCLIDGKACHNNGFGTKCTRCEISETRCQYVAPESLWVVNNSRWEDRIHAGDEITDAH